MFFGTAQGPLKIHPDIHLCFPTRKKDRYYEERQIHGTRSGGKPGGGKSIPTKALGIPDAIWNKAHAANAK